MANGMQKSKSGDTNRYRVWLNQSQYDLEAAKISLENNIYEWTCYQSIQSVEKAFKAIIVHAGYRPPKTHRLGVLVSMSNRANNLFEDVKFNFRKIESYTFISRYPFVIPGNDMTPREMINKQDADTCFEIATDIHNKISGFLVGRETGSDKDISMEDYYFTEQEISSRLEEVVEIIRKSEKIKTEKIILFGSFAREKTRPKASTMDVLVIGRTDLDFVERIGYIKEVTRGKEPFVEPLVYTPEEFHELYEEEGEGFLESAIDEGRVLWEI